MTRPNVAVIGLGNMGGPMAANLVKAGVTVNGFDVVDAATTKATEAGVTVHDTAVDAAQASDVIITMLPNGGLVAQVLIDIIDAVGDNAKIFVDCSTISVGEAQSNAELVGARGHRYLDAPVSGGVAGAAAGTLAFMVGGNEEDLESIRPLLDIMGRSITLCGPVGTGEAAKLCNNMILGVQQIAVAEGLVMGQRLGLTSQAFFDVVSNSTGSCWALTTNCPAPGVLGNAPADNDYTPGFATDLIVKDLNLAMDSVEATGTDAQLGRLAAQIYSQLQADGLGTKDCSVIFDELKDRN